ncbi:hypothetical protein [Vibrio aquimaris]|uniref:Uncharacterized protein n=1 Tax=Vibrio aquimaris TaxID=2587862 RepID=A0A5P9CS82_9VIBR|nr:hypothetical protein [Vibrio aquimaris]QFT28811.1 hypothetical protein FIV01_20630 [Vibrio aquimaris]
MSDLDFTKHWTSDRTRRKQTALTRLSNGLLKEVIEDPFSKDLFEREEIEAMKVAAQALSNAKKKFAHIKERKVRIEKRKDNELANIEKQYKQYAIETLNSLNPNPDTFTREQFCLWVAAASFTGSLLNPENWELDINDGIDKHYLENDNALRKRNVQAMREKAIKTFEHHLRRSWKFSFKNDSWEVIVPIKEAAMHLKNLMNHQKYIEAEKNHAYQLEHLEAYNREVEAVKRRKDIKSV